MDNLSQSEQRDKANRLAAVRIWFRSVMPTVALVAAALFIVWLLLRRLEVYRTHDLFWPFGLLTFLSVALTCSYYGFRALRFLKRRLLWRVRRRLLITYLFVGLTPVVLMALLGALAWFAVSSEAMSRVLSSQLGTSERQVRARAKELAGAWDRRPRTDERTDQAWLDEQMQRLQADLPGASVALIPRKGHAGNVYAAQASKSIIAEPETSEQNSPFANSRDVEADTRLPSWLDGKSEWSGLTFNPLAVDSDDVFAPPFFRALVPVETSRENYDLLLTVPLNRAYIQQLRQNTGINVMPYFLARPEVVRGGSNSVTITNDDGQNGQSKDAQVEDELEGRLRVDQMGEPIRGTSSAVIVNTTNWATGERSEQVVFLFNWSFAESKKHLLEGGTLGNIFRRLLIGTAVVFLVLELLALISAAWITRAVTGTVHKLYRATEYIKRGDFSHRVTVRSRDQLGELAMAFNEMSENIESLLEERVERERLQREVEIAAEVQAQLFPKTVPTLFSAELSAECRAALGVAGDYYDYIEIAPGMVAVALGDVSGKGVSASLVMSNLQAALRAQTSIIAERLKAVEKSVPAIAGAGGDAGGSCEFDAGDSECAVERVVSAINHQLCQSTDDNRFATLFVGIYNERTCRLSYTNAGHNAPILIRSDATVDRLSTGGLMVGAFDWARYEEATVQLHEDDTLVMFSDGISEVENSAGEEFGEKRLIPFTVANRHLSAEAMRKALFAELERWSGSTERDDDQTLVIMKSTNALCR